MTNSRTHPRGGRKFPITLLVGVFALVLLASAAIVMAAVGIILFPEKTDLQGGPPNSGEPLFNPGLDEVAQAALAGQELVIVPTPFDARIP